MALSVLFSLPDTCTDVGWTFPEQVLYDCTPTGCSGSVEWQKGDSVRVFCRQINTESSR